MVRSGAAVTEADEATIAEAMGLGV